MSAPTPSDVNPSQLVRYVVRLASPADPDSLGQMRQVLTSLGLLVDRLEATEAEVLVLQAPGPGLEGIRQALQAGGFAVLDISTQSA